MTRLLSLIPILGLIAPLQLFGESTVHMTILPTSRLTLKGTSTLHSYECHTTAIHGEIEMDAQLKSFVAAEVTIPVNSIHSESTSMDGNMYDALKAKEWPEIKFTLLSYDTASQVRAGGTDSAVSFSGKLLIAGKERSVDLQVSVSRAQDGTIKIDGAKRLLMTDYGIAPPTFMLGVLKTGNEVTVEFHLDLKSTNPVAHTLPSKN